MATLIKLKQISAADGSTSNDTHIPFQDGNGSLNTAAGLVFDDSTNRLTATQIGAFTAKGAIDFDNQNMTNVDIDSGAIDGVTIGGAAAPTVTNLGSVATCDINGGTIDGITSLTVGTDGSGADVTFYSATAGDTMLWDASEEQLKITGTSGQVALDIDTGNLTVGAYGLTDAGAATIASMAGDWTNAGRTVADAGTLTTVDINGGTIDGVTLGGTLAGSPTFSGAPQIASIELSHASANTLTASGGILSIENVAIPTISSSDTLTNKTLTSPDINGPDIDGGTVDAVTSLTVAANATFQVGSDGDGSDVKFFSDTAGDYMEWDTSAKRLIVQGTASSVALYVGDGTVNFGSDLAVGGDMSVTGDLTVAGNATMLSTTELVVEDSAIYLSVPGGLRTASYTADAASNSVTGSYTSHGFATGEYVYHLDTANSPGFPEGTKTVTRIDDHNYSWTESAGIASDIASTEMQAAAVNSDDDTANYAGIYIPRNSAQEASFAWSKTTGWTVEGAGSNGDNFDLGAGGSLAFNGTSILTADGAAKVTVAAITSATAMTGDVVDADELLINDGGALKRVDFSVFRDAVFNDVSADATIADGGGLTIANDAITGAKIALFDDSLAATSTHFLIADGTDYSSFALSGDVTCSNAGAVTIANDAVESGMLNDNVISGQTELAQGSLAAADELMISDGGTLKKFGVDSLAKDMMALTTEAAIANGDYLMFLDGSGTGETKKEALADLATLFAGDGLEAGSSVLAVHCDDSTIEIDSDAIRLKDNGVTLAKMAGLARGKFIYGDASGDPAALAVGSAHQFLQHDGTDLAWVSMSGDVTLAAGVATIGSGKIEAAMLDATVISSQAATMADGDVQGNDTLLITDTGTGAIQKVAAASLATYMSSANMSKVQHTIVNGSNAHAESEALTGVNHGNASPGADSSKPNQDLYLNGQLLNEGTNHNGSAVIGGDYYFGTAVTKYYFAFALEAGDIVSWVKRA